MLPSSGAHGQTSRPFNATLDLSSKLGLLSQAGGAQGPTVTFVPVNPQVKPDAMAPTFKFKKIVVVTKRVIAPVYQLAAVLSRLSTFASRSMATVSADWLP